MLPIFHRTNQNAAEKILQTGKFLSKEHDGRVYFSTRAESSQTTGYGDVTISAEIPLEYAEPDDMFQDGEYHISILPENQKHIRNLKVQ